MESCNFDTSDHNKSNIKAIPADNPITIKVWHIWSIQNDAQEQAIHNSATDIMTKYPNIKIEIEAIDNQQYKKRLRTAMAANEIPDIFLTWGYGFSKPFVESGRLLDLTDYITKDGFVHTFINGFPESGTYNNRHYIICNEMQVALLYCNKVYFNTYDIKVPNTFADLKNTIKILTSKGIKPFSVGGKDKSPLLLWYSYILNRVGGSQIFQDAVNGKIPFNNKSFIEAGNELQDLIRLGGFGQQYAEIGNNEASVEFLKGDSAMYLSGEWDIEAFDRYWLTDVIDIIKFPLAREGKSNINSWIGGNIVGFAVNAKTKYKNEAVLVCEELSKRKERYEADKGVIAMNVFKDIKIKAGNAKSLTKKLGSLLSNAESFSCWPDALLEPADIDQLYNMVYDIATFTKTPENACNSFEQYMRSK